MTCVSKRRNHLLPRGRSVEADGRSPTIIAQLDCKAVLSSPHTDPWRIHMVVDGVIHAHEDSVPGLDISSTGERLAHGEVAGVQVIVVGIQEE